MAGAQSVPPPPPPNPKLGRQPSTAGTPAVEGAVPLVIGGALATQSAVTPDVPDAYLASSAALLESLAASPASPSEPRQETKEETPWTSLLGTPLGMGGLLLLLVASAGLGYALVNPVAIRHLATQTPLARFWAADSGEAGSTDAETLSANRSEQPASVQQPDLSQSEFTDLSLSNLSTLPGNIDRQLNANSSNTASSTPTTTEVAPELSSNSTNSTETSTNPSTDTPTAVATQPRPVPQPVSAAQPQPRPANPTTATLPAVPTTTAAPTPAAETASQPEPPAPLQAVAANDQTYYVVADYTGDPSLATAREVVGDAYVHNFPVGARIQLGVYNSEADAAADAAALQSQGIGATVYAP